MNTCGDRTLRRGCLRAGWGDAVWAHLCSKPSSAGRGDAQNAGCGVSFLRGFRVSAGADSRSALPWVSRGSGGSGAVPHPEPPAPVSQVQADVPTGPQRHKPNRDEALTFSESSVSSVFNSVLYSEIMSLLLSKEG